MEQQVKTKIPTSLLPSNYKTLASEEFGITEGTVYAIASGFRANNAVSDFLLGLAKEKKAEADKIKAARLQQIEELTK